MDFSPSPGASGTRSSTSPLMSSDLGLDPSDPLNLLLHNTSQHGADSSMEDSSSSQGSSPPDWSQFSSFWASHQDNEDPAGNQKEFTDLMDFSNFTSLPMNMDFGSTMAIEPSALQLNSMDYDYASHNLANELLNTQFPFTFQPSMSSLELSSISSQSEHNHGRSTSVTSFSSSSGVSHAPTNDSEQSPAFTNDPAAELAERVRQSAGVMLAVPMGAQLHGHGADRHVALPITAGTDRTTSVSAATSKLPIPRLPRTSSNISASPVFSSGSSSAASTPPPATPPPSGHSVSPAPSGSSNAEPSIIGQRPKTSHTTIERRYRTNLNARIQSLRMAVPALRVLEDRGDGANGKKVKVKMGKVEAGTTGNSGEEGDIIDERGFVDGVKVARKCSKANVLGKAVEYIRVLKKREHRLKAEQSGLKSLVSGLVGGPALLKEWEREWRERFGGAERDEVEGEPEVEDSDEEDDDDEEGEGRKRKRAKAAVTTVKKKEPAVKKEKTTPVQMQDGPPAEKRKRGRPRKALPLPASVPSFAFSAQPQSQPQVQNPSAQMEQTRPAPSEYGHPQAQQYLLATVALFSFFNYPSTSSTPFSASQTDHVHTGTVLSAHQPPSFSTSGAMPDTWGWREVAQTFHLLVSVVVLLSVVGTWFGMRPLDFNSVVRKLVLRLGVRKADENWMKAGEDYALRRAPETNMSVVARFQAYKGISSLPNAGVRELSASALVVFSLGPLGRTKAHGIWGSILRKKSRTFERLVVEGMSVGEAAERLVSRQEEENDDAQTPMEVLACMLVQERIKRHLEVLFVRSVAIASGSVTVGKTGIGDEEEMREEIRLRATVDAAKELGGRVAVMGRQLERVWKPFLVDGDEILVNDNDSQERGGIAGEIQALLTALVLCRRLFNTRADELAATMLLSPPPSPGRGNLGAAEMVSRLRRVLGSRLFERCVEGDVLEDARDKAVDMVVAFERKGRGMLMGRS